MLERLQVMFWNRYVVFKALSLLESGNFSWKPSWHVHTTRACIDNFATKMAACPHWTSGEAKIVTSVTSKMATGRKWRQRRPVYVDWWRQWRHRHSTTLIDLLFPIMRKVYQKSGYPFITVQCTLYTHIKHFQRSQTPMSMLTFRRGKLRKGDSLKLFTLAFIQV